MFWSKAFANPVSFVSVFFMDGWRYFTPSCPRIILDLYVLFILLIASFIALVGHLRSDKTAAIPMYPKVGAGMPVGHKFQTVLPSLSIK